MTKIDGVINNNPDKRAFVIVGIVLLLVAASLVSYKVGKRAGFEEFLVVSRTTSSPSPTTVQVVTTSPLVTEAPNASFLPDFKAPANWKTQSNNRYNFSISYPSDAKYSYNSSNGRATIEKENLSIWISAEGFAEKDLFKSVENDTEYGKPQRDIVNGVVVYRYKSNSRLDTKILLPKPIPPTNDPWVITIQGVAKNSEAEELYNQIISTFRFN